MAAMNADFTSLLDEQQFSAFFAAWREHCRPGKLPLRSDIRLQQFAPFAADLLIYELVGPGDLRSRLMGSSVSDRVKIRQDGVNWLDLVAPGARPAGVRWWHTLVETPCAGMMQFSTGFTNGTNRICRSLLLPLDFAGKKNILLVYNRASSVYRVDEPRDQLVISQECFQTKYMDIGFGLPEGVPEADDAITIEHSILEKLYGPV